jgi:hypothetical protein
MFIFIYLSIIYLIVYLFVVRLRRLSVALNFNGVSGLQSMGRRWTMDRECLICNATLVLTWRKWETLARRGGLWVAIVAETWRKLAERAGTYRNLPKAAGTYRNPERWAHREVLLILAPRKALTVPAEVESGTMSGNDACQWQNGPDLLSCQTSYENRRLTAVLAVTSYIFMSQLSPQRISILHFLEIDLYIILPNKSWFIRSPINITYAFFTPFLRVTCPANLTYLHFILTNVKS